MKRRNAESGKMRRPVKRTKITDGMYGNSLLYLKFVMVWATVVLADYMLEFRFEFLWPFWMMLRSVYDSFKYQGLAFSVFFICIALTSDMICFFFIPLQYIFLAASTYVWVQYVWYTFADKGICVPTVAVCCVLVYVETAWRGERGGGFELCRPLAAHCVGYPVVTLGFGVKSYVGHRLRLRRQRQVRQENEFYFQLLRDALPESALETQQQTKEKEPEQKVSSNGECAHANDARQMNGSVRRKKPEPGLLLDTQAKLEKLEKHVAARERAAAAAHAHTHGAHYTHAHAHTPHAHTNGAPLGAGSPPAAPEQEDRHDHSKGSAKSSKCEKKEASTLKEEKKKNRNKDKDKDNHSDSHKGTEQTKEQIVKEVESTKENHIRNHKDCNNYKEKEREKERERERETREKERERERERERDREQREARECAEELRRVRAELSAARAGEADARRALAARAAADSQRRLDHLHLKQAHASLQHKVSAWRSSERAALERRLGEERRARTHAEHQLQRQRNKNNNGECENEWCLSRRSAAENETTTLRRELRRVQDLADLLQRDLNQATEQVRSLEARGTGGSGGADNGAGSGSRLAGACALLQERAAHLERSLSAETRVKLDLLSALGDAKRQLNIQEGLISKQEKEIEELKAQMLAVMPSEYVTPVSGTLSKLRLESSPLDPNASVYTPKQLCSDA